MTCTATCGSHCGVSSGREGHCDCALCHDGNLVPARAPAVRGGTSMCSQWYSRCGSYRPWHGYANASCGCGLNVRYPDGVHDKDCPVRSQHDRRTAP